jgi:hypothetical protein
MFDSFITAALALLSLCAVAPQDRAASPPSPPKAPPIFPRGAEMGVPGQMSPMTADIRMPDTIVHQDKTGGTQQSLRVLSGSEGGGFAAVWQDQRDARLGLYVLRLDAKGDALEPEFSANEPTAGRGLDTAIAIAPDGSGAVAWTSPQPETPPVAWLRFFDSKGHFLAPDKALGVIHSRANEGPGPRRSGAAQVSVIRRHDGGYAIAWTEDGQVKMLEASATGEWRDRPGVVNPEAMKAQPGVRLGVEKGGGLLCAWKSAEGYVAVAMGQAPDPLRKTPKGGPRSCGDGVLEKVEPDPEGGFWGLFQMTGVFELRHLSPSGDADRPAIHPVEDSLSGADLARWHGGLALLAEHASGSIEVVLLGSDARRLEEKPMLVTSPDARGIGEGRIASNGSILFVAWTDHRNGDGDVYGRTLDPRLPPEKRLGPERRLNTDTASSSQIKPAIAGSGSRAVIAWHDERDVQPHVYARLVTWPGGFAGDEFQVPVALPGSSLPAPSAVRSIPAVSMRPEGDFVVVWAEGPPQRIALKAQLFQADAHPLGDPVLLRDLGRAPSRVAAAALPGDRGYLLAWDDPVERSLSVSRLTPGGKLLEPKKIAEAPKGGVQEPSLAVSEGDRAIVAWSSNAGDGAWSVRARFLDLEGEPQGVELGFERTVRGQDWDPSLAPASGGGFLMSWCSGARGDPGKDVVARLFDDHGRPAGPLLPISPISNEQDHGHVIRVANGTWVVTWEDDISAHDQTYLRRIDKNGKDLGPTVHINELETLCIPDRQGPLIAPLADGIAAVWSDRRRSKGWDVYAKIVGPRFDEVRRR